MEIGLALQPAERPHPPLAHPYIYPHGVGGGPVDASDGGPVIPSLAWAGAASTAGAMAGDVPSLARWGHALLGGHVLQPSSLRAMTRFRAGEIPWDGYGLGLARTTINGLTAWGHGGDGLGTHTEFWHLPGRNLTVAITWNDDVLDGEAPFLRHLVALALAAQ